MKPALLVGFLGEFKTGKSYFLSRLAGSTYEHSLTKATQGLSFVFGGEGMANKIYYVDSAGSGEPLQIFADYKRKPSDFGIHIGKDEEDKPLYFNDLRKNDTTKKKG
jgi:hypothetical protein